MDFNKIMQQAQAMQKQLEKTTDEINKKEFEASRAVQHDPLALSRKNNTTTLGICQVI